MVVCTGQAHLDEINRIKVMLALLEVGLGVALCLTGIDDISLEVGEELEDGSRRHNLA